MTKTCFLHVGLHKTASSSFQVTCAKNIAYLRNNGITYPLFNCDHAGIQNIQNHSIPIFSLFTEQPQEYRINKQSNILNNIKAVNSSYESQLEKLLESSNKLIISGEDISVLSKNSLSRFIQTILQHGYEIKATALVRSPYSAVCSEIQQMIKGGHYFELISLNDRVPESFRAESFSKLKVLENLKSVLRGSISFHSFKHACMHAEGPVGFLLEKFLHQNPSNFKLHRANTSFSNLSVRVQNEFNAVNPALINTRLNPDFRKFPAKVDRRLKFSGKFLLTKNEYKLIEDFVQAETDALCSITGIDLSDEKIKHSKPVSLRKR